MATRRCIRPLISRCCSTKHSNPSLNLHYSSLASRFALTDFRSTQTIIPKRSSIFSDFQVPFSLYSRNFCSENKTTNIDDDDDDSDESEAEDSEDDEIENVQGKSEEEKAQEAAEIGYEVIGPLQESDSVFKPYEPVFAVVQVFSFFFLVSFFKSGNVLFVVSMFISLLYSMYYISPGFWTICVRERLRIIAFPLLILNLLFLYIVFCLISNNFTVCVMVMWTCVDWVSSV